MADLKSAFKTHVFLSHSALLSFEMYIYHSYSFNSNLYTNRLKILSHRKADTAVPGNTGLVLTTARSMSVLTLCLSV